MIIVFITKYGNNMMQYDTDIVQGSLILILQVTKMGPDLNHLLVMMEVEASERNQYH